MDGQGRRRLRLHADRGPRRLGPARGRPDDQRDRRPPRTTPTSRASRRTRRAPWADATTPRATMCLFATHSRRLQRALPRRAGRPSTARRPTRDPFVQTAQILPLAFGLVPDDRRAAASPRRLADDILKHARRPCLRRRARRAVRAARAHGDGSPRRGVRRRHADRPSRAGATGRTSAGFTALGRALVRHDALAQPPLLRRDRAVALRGPGRDAAPGAGLRADRVQPEIPRAGLDRVAATYESVRGTVATRWRRTAAGPRAGRHGARQRDRRVYVPAPGRRRSPRSAGADAWWRAQAASGQARRRRGDRVVYDVGSGHYQFRVVKEP